LRRTVFVNRSRYRGNQKRSQAKKRKYATHAHSSARPYVHTSNYTLVADYQRQSGVSNDNHVMNGDQCLARAYGQLKVTNVMQTFPWARVDRACANRKN
jgi:hypothetical protein